VSTIPAVNVPTHMKTLPISKNKQRIISKIYDSAANIVEKLEGVRKFNQGGGGERKKSLAKKLFFESWRGQNIG